MATESTPEAEFEDAQKDLSPIERKLTTGVGLFVGLLALVMVALPVVQAIARKVADTEIPSATRIINMYSTKACPSSFLASLRMPRF